SQQVSYNPSQYAAPGSRGGTAESQNSNATYRGSYAHHQLAGQLDDDEDYPQMDYGQPSKVSKSLASRVAKSKKPEWNSEFSEEAAEVREAPPVQSARVAPKPVAKRRPEWNDDGDVNYSEPEPPVAPKSAPKPANAQRAPAARSRFDEEEVTTPLDRAFPSRQKKPDQQASQSQQQRQQQQEQPPQSSARHAAVPANRRVPLVATRGGKAPPPIPEPTGPMEQLLLLHLLKNAYFLLRFAVKLLRDRLQLCSLGELLTL
ncbi:Hypothetical protein, putative, partial [Bodo saltans]